MFTLVNNTSRFARYKRYRNQRIWHVRIFAVADHPHCAPMIVIDPSIDLPWNSVLLRSLILTIESPVSLSVHTHIHEYSYTLAGFPGGSPNVRIFDAQVSRGEDSRRRFSRRLTWERESRREYRFSIECEIALGVLVSFPSSQSNALPPFTTLLSLWSQSSMFLLSSRKKRCIGVTWNRNVQQSNAEDREINC